MTRRIAVWALALAGAVGPAACGSAERDHIGGSHEFPPPSTATSVLPATRPTAARGSTTTAPPRVFDRGDDYVAIWHSLDGYRIWLEQHHPDPAFIPRVWVTGSAIAT